MYWKWEKQTLIFHVTVLEKKIDKNNIFLQQINNRYKRFWNITQSFYNLFKHFILVDIYWSVHGIVVYVYNTAALKNSNFI